MLRLKFLGTENFHKILFFFNPKKKLFPNLGHVDASTGQQNVAEGTRCWNT